MIIKLNEKIFTKINVKYLMMPLMKTFLSHITVGVFFFLTIVLKTNNQPPEKLCISLGLFYESQEIFKNLSVE